MGANVRHSFVKAAALACAAMAHSAFAQTVTYDQNIDVPCLGFVLKNSRTNIACNASSSVSTSVVDNFNREGVAIDSNNGVLLAAVCGNNSAGSPPKNQLLKIAKLVDIYNGLTAKAHGALLQCDFNSSLVYRKQANEILRKMAGQVEDRSDDKLSEINPNLSIDDLEAIFDVTPVNERYEMAKNVFDISSASSPDSLNELADEVRGDSIVAELVQDAAKRFEDIGATIVRLQIRFTPGAEVNSEDLKAIDFLQNKMPVIIRDMFSSQFK